MNPIRFYKKIESETVHLPELKPLIGTTVEIIVKPQPAVQGATPAERWDAAFQAARELEDYDFDAWRVQRDYDLHHATDHLP